MVKTLADKARAFLTGKIVRRKIVYNPFQSDGLPHLKETSYHDVKTGKRVKVNYDCPTEKDLKIYPFDNSRFPDPYFDPSRGLISMKDLSKQDSNQEKELVEQS